MSNPIHIEDNDAIERLTARIAVLEATQARMKAANAAIRANKAKGQAAQVAALVALGIREGDASQLIQPDFCGRIGFANYVLTNNNANIRRLREQLARAQEAHSTPAREIDGADGIRLEDCPSDNRVRLFFPGKPDETTRGKLKRSGFRWSPSLGCWQAYRNGFALGVAASFVKTSEIIAAAEVAEEAVLEAAAAGTGLTADDMREVNALAGEPDYGGVLAADGCVYSDADPGL